MFQFLLIGETGCGKEFAAHLIHKLSDRREHPFIGFNIAVIPPNLISSELLGFAKGAFSGAISSRAGKVELANAGTILLDEIGDVGLDVQAIILSILEVNAIRRLGDTVQRKIDVRIIAASNKNLQELVQDGFFRADLLNRLSGISIVIPPLRERRADIPELAAHILNEISKQQGRTFQLSASAIKALKKYDYPGNIRQLQNILQRAAILTEGLTINTSTLDLSTSIIAPRRRPRMSTRLELAHAEIQRLQREIEALRDRSIVAAPIWQGHGFAIQHDYCFVLMPFSEKCDLQAAYRDHVKPVIERCGLRCERADDIYDVSGVMQSVWEGINKSRVVIADLTNRNANVFYELGIAHTLGKPVIMISQSIDFVPFDLRHLRCIVYKYTPRGATILEQALERTIKTVLSTSVDTRTS